MEYYAVVEALARKLNEVLAGHWGVAVVHFHSEGALRFLQRGAEHEIGSASQSVAIAAHAASGFGPRSRRPRSKSQAFARDVHQRREQR